MSISLPTCKVMAIKNIHLNHEECRLYIGTGSRFWLGGG